MTDINGPGGAGNHFDTDNGITLQVNESKLLAEGAKFLPDSLSAEARSRNVNQNGEFMLELGGSSRGAPPHWVVANIDGMPVPMLESVMAEHVAYSNDDLVTALYPSAADSPTADGWDAVREFGAEKLGEVIRISKLVNKGGIEAVAPGDLKTLSDTAQLLGDIELVQDRLGLHETEVGQFIGIASAVTNSVSAAVGAVMADPETGRELLEIIFSNAESTLDLMADPSSTYLGANAELMTKLEGFAYGSTASIVKNQVFSDLDVPRLPNGMFDTDQEPSLREVNDHELQQNAQFIRLVDPFVETTMPTMTTGAYLPYGGPHSLDFSLAEFIGLGRVADDEAAPEDVAVEQDQLPETATEEPEPVVREGEPGFLDRTIEVPASAAEEEEPLPDVLEGVDAEAVKEQATEVLEDVELILEDTDIDIPDETVVETQSDETIASPRLGQPVSVDLERIEESAADLDTAIDVAMDVGDGASILFDTRLMSRFTVFLEDLSKTLDQITPEEAAEIGGIISEVGLKLIDSLSALEVEGLTGEPIHTAVSIVTDVLAAVFYASDRLAPREASQLLSGIVQPVTETVGEIFAMSFEEYALNGQINVQQQNFMSDAQELSKQVYDEIYEFVESQEEAGASD